MNGTGLPDDLQIDLEGCIDADVPKFVMFSPFIQKSTAILLKGFRMHEVFKYIHPDPFVATRNQKRQLTTATCAVAKERRDDTLERSISCDCSLQECTGEIVCVIEVPTRRRSRCFLMEWRAIILGPLLSMTYLTVCRSEHSWWELEV